MNDLQKNITKIFHNLIVLGPHLIELNVTVLFS